MVYILTAGQRLSMPGNTGCACPGDELIFTCTVVGNGTTSWEGTAFDCAANRIVLRHNLFASVGATGECNGGAIVGRSLGANKDCYTSQLEVLTIDHTFSNKTIACIHSGIDTIGTAVVMILEGILL